MSLRPVPVVKIARAVPPPKGAKPDGIVWLDPKTLVVDARYQRELGDKGVVRVREIALKFDWGKFPPLIVAALPGGGHAIIDGQHRAAAVLARGDIAKVPAWVVTAGVTEQAETFLSINAQSARVPVGAMWYARAASGDARALQLLELCREAGVEVLKWPLAADRRRHFQTNSPNAISDALGGHGKRVTMSALGVLVKAGELAGRSLLTLGLIRAAVLLAKFDDLWKSPHVHVALAGLDFDGIEACATLAVKAEGGTRIEHMLRLVRERLHAKMREAA